MGFAWVLHTLSIIAVMVPSLLNKKGIFENLYIRFSIVTVSHAILGSLVEILGIWLIGTWALRSHDVKVCFKRKRIMDVTFLLWLLELILGVYVYMMLYVPI